eukprot:scaffold1763_cov181-Amphora_coffeaeformis.AAC.3
MKRLARARPYRAGTTHDSDVIPPRISKKNSDYGYWYHTSFVDYTHFLHTMPDKPTFVIQTIQTNPVSILSSMARQLQLHSESR